MALFNRSPGGKPSQSYLIGSYSKYSERCTEISRFCQCEGPDSEFVEYASGLYNHPASKVNDSRPTVTLGHDMPGLAYEVSALSGAVGLTWQDVVMEQRTRTAVERANYTT